VLTAASFIRRLTIGALLPGLVVAGSASAVVQRADAVRLTGPKRIVQGADVSYRAAVRSGARCTLNVRYRSGAQRVTEMSTGGSATFRFKVPQRAATGAARVSVSCGRAGGARLKVVVIGGVVPAKINVVKHGFSHRARLSGSVTSWGVVLSNESPTSDAMDVTVLANFVLPDNRLIGSATKRVSRIRAGSHHALGGDLSFPGYPPIARLEIVVQVSDSKPNLKAMPGVANAHAVPGLFDAAYVGSIEGEVANDRLDRTLRRAELSAVALDGAGNVLGGAVGSASASLPPGSRQFFKISGLTGVPFAQVASVMVSVSPTWDD
jgi:hypothetical protein